MRKKPKLHRKEYPRVFERVKDGKTWYIVDCRREGYSGQSWYWRESLTQAIKIAQTVAEEVKTKGAVYAAITPKDTYLLNEAKAILEPYNLNVLEAAQYVIKFKALETANKKLIPIELLAEEWYKEKEAGTFKHIRKITLIQIKRTRDLVTRLWGSKLCVDVNSEDVINYIKSRGNISFITKRNIRTHIHGFFQWCVDEKKQIEKNPCKGIRFKLGNDESDEVKIFTIKQVKDILCECLNSDPECIHYFAISFFSGMRPEEVKRLKREYVDLDNKRIYVPNFITKVKETRYVPIKPVLMWWIRSYPLKGEKVVPRNFRKRIDRIKANLGYKHWKLKPDGKLKWIQDGMRHTFASNWLAVNDDDKVRLAGDMGNSIEVIKKHYRKAVKKEAAEYYFKINPINVFEPSFEDDNGEFIDPHNIPIDDDGQEIEYAGEHDYDDVDGSLVSEDKKIQ